MPNFLTMLFIFAGEAGKAEMDTSLGFDMNEVVEVPKTRNDSAERKTRPRPGTALAGKRSSTTEKRASSSAGHRAESTSSGRSL